MRLTGICIKAVKRSLIFVIGNQLFYSYGEYERKNKNREDIIYDRL